MSKTSFSDAKHWLRTARTITEALPFMRRYAGQTFVIKYGGHAMGDEELSKLFARDIRHGAAVQAGLVDSHIVRNQLQLRL